MCADFLINADPTRNLLHVTMSGLFAIEDVGKFVEARTATYGHLRSRDHLSLVDIREMKVQSREVVDAFAVVLANPRTQAKRLAFVVARSLAWLQIQWAANGRGARYFTDYNEAARWVLAGDPAK